MKNCKMIKIWMLCVTLMEKFIEQWMQKKKELLRLVGSQEINIGMKRYFLQHSWSMIGDKHKKKHGV